MSHPVVRFLCVSVVMRSQEGFYTILNTLMNGKHPTTYISLLLLFNAQLHPTVSKANFSIKKKFLLRNYVLLKLGR